METLPSEIILRILEYLSFEDRQRMALVNTSWYYASIHPLFLKKEQFVFNEEVVTKYDNPFEFSASFSPDGVPILKFKGEEYLQIKREELGETFKQLLLKSKRVFLNLKVEKNTSINETLLENLGSRLTSLSLKNLGRLQDSRFLDSIIFYCDNLETLEFEHIKYFSFNGTSGKQLLNLKKLTIKDVDLSDKDFNSLMKHIPNLEDLGILNCNIQEDMKVIHRFYPDLRIKKLTSFNSNDVFTFINILNFLETTTSLNTLRMSRCYKILMQLPNHIQLKSILMQGDHLLNVIEREPGILYDNISLALSSQTSLQMLEIHDIHTPFLPIISNLKNLIHLKIYFLYGSIMTIDDDTEKQVETFAKSLSQMKYLKTLVIDSPGTILKLEDIFRIPVIPDCTIKSLKSLQCIIGNGYNIVTLGTNLTSLSIRKGEIFSANELKLLFKNLTKLRHLEIQNCIHLVDDILTGSSDSENSSLSNLKGLITLNLGGGNLTYKCLRTFKLMDLKVLHIGRLSVEHCIKLKNTSDFEDCLKNLNCILPSLRTFSLEVPNKEYDWLSEHGVSNKLVQNMFKNVKRFFFKY